MPFITCKSVTVEDCKLSKMILYWCFPPNDHGLVICLSSVLSFGNAFFINSLPSFCALLAFSPGCFQLSKSYFRFGVLWSPFLLLSILLLYLFVLITIGCSPRWNPITFFIATIRIDCVYHGSLCFLVVLQRKQYSSFSVPSFSPFHSFLFGCWC